MSKFLKEHKKNLKKLTKKELIQQVLNHIEIDAHVNNQFDMAYEKLENEKQVCEAELINTEKELEETKESLMRSRGITDSWKSCVDSQLSIIKRLERWITNTWFVSDRLSTELPGWIEENMIEHKIWDKKQGKFAILIK